MHQRFFFFSRLLFILFLLFSLHFSVQNQKRKKREMFECGSVVSRTYDIIFIENMLLNRMLTFLNNNEQKHQDKIEYIAIWNYLLSSMKLEMKSNFFFIFSFRMRVCLVGTLCEILFSQ